MKKEKNKKISMEKNYKTNLLERNSNIHKQDSEKNIENSKTEINQIKETTLQKTKRLLKEEKKKTRSLTQKLERRDSKIATLSEENKILKGEKKRQFRINDTNRERITGIIASKNVTIRQQKEKINFYEKKLETLRVQKEELISNLEISEEEKLKYIKRIETLELEINKIKQNESEKKDAIEENEKTILTIEETIKELKSHAFGHNKNKELFLKIEEFEGILGLLKNQQSENNKDYLGYKKSAGYFIGAATIIGLSGCGAYLNNQNDLLKNDINNYQSQLSNKNYTIQDLTEQGRISNETNKRLSVNIKELKETAGLLLKDLSNTKKDLKIIVNKNETVSKKYSKISKKYYDILSGVVNKDKFLTLTLEEQLSSITGENSENILKQISKGEEFSFGLKNDDLINEINLGDLKLNGISSLYFKDEKGLKIKAYKLPETYSDKVTKYLKGNFYFLNGNGNFQRLQLIPGKEIKISFLKNKENSEKIVFNNYSKKFNDLTYSELSKDQLYDILTDKGNVHNGVSELNILGIQDKKVLEIMAELLENNQAYKVSSGQRSKGKQEALGSIEDGLHLVGYAGDLVRRDKNYSEARKFLTKTGFKKITKFGTTYYERGKVQVLFHGKGSSYHMHIENEEGKEILETVAKNGNNGEIKEEEFDKIFYDPKNFSFIKNFGIKKFLEKNDECEKCFSKTDIEFFEKIKGENFEKEIYKAFPKNSHYKLAKRIKGIKEYLAKNKNKDGFNDLVELSQSIIKPIDLSYQDIKTTLIANIEGKL